MFVHLGGPGAGSEFGLFTELGPYELSDQSLKTKEFNETGIPTLFRNKYSWTTVANILMYDSPPPVGFSYCGSNVSGDGYSCGDWDDYRTAKAAHTFVENWMKDYPECIKLYTSKDYSKYEVCDFVILHDLLDASHDLYLAGESYGGKLTFSE